MTMASSPGEAQSSCPHQLVLVILRMGLSIVEILVDPVLISCISPHWADGCLASRADVKNSTITSLRGLAVVVAPGASHCDESPLVHV